MNKKIKGLMSLLLLGVSGLSFAQQDTVVQVMKSCSVQNNVVVCPVQITRGIQNLGSGSGPSIGNTGSGSASPVDPSQFISQVDTNITGAAKEISGSHSSRVSNPFIFCMGPRPPKWTPLRAIYDQICKDGKVQNLPPDLKDPLVTGNNTNNVTPVVTQVCQEIILETGVKDQDRKSVV